MERLYRQRRVVIAVATLLTVFVTLGSVHIDALGIPSEEILPHLFEHPRVADSHSIESATLEFEAPYDLPGGKERTGLLVTEVWPVLSVVVPPQSYPLLMEVWQSAHLSYVTALTAPLLGGGIEGLRRTGMVLGALLLLVIVLLAPRLSEERWLGVIAAAWLGSSVGFLFAHRTAYLIETGPPLLATLALYWALDRRDGRFVLAGLTAGLALSAKMTTGWLFVGMAVFLLLTRCFPRHRPKIWIAAIAAALFAMAPLIFFFFQKHDPEIVRRTTSFLSEPLRALERLPRTAWVTAIYLGHPQMILEPAIAGKLRIVPSAWGAIVPAVVTLFAGYRVVRRPHDRRPELLWLCTMLAVVGFAALLYDDDNPFQIALLIEPFYAIVVARALYALHRVLATRGRPLLIAAGLALAVAISQGAELASFVCAHRTIGNPMLAMGAQRQLVAELLSRHVEEPLTTTYNSMGVYEFLSGGRVRPVHLYRMLQPRPNMTPREYRDASVRGWTVALSAAPGPVVLPLGDNLFEGGRQDRRVVREAFFSACEQLGVRAREVARFPSDGPPALGLYEIVGVPHLEQPLRPTATRAREDPAAHAREHPAEAEVPAGPATRALLGGLRPGARLGALVVDAVSEPLEGAILVHAHADTAERTTFEVRLYSTTPSPPARSRGYAIYYGRSSGTLSTRVLVESAQALAAFMDDAAKDLRPPSGLSRHPNTQRR